MVMLITYESEISQASVRETYLIDR